MVDSPSSVQPKRPRSSSFQDSRQTRGVFGGLDSKVRVVDVNTELMRQASPDAFAVWQAGGVRPYWFTAARMRAGLGAMDVEETFGGAVAPVEAGKIYPPWTFLCRFADWIGCDVEELTQPSPRVSPPMVSSRANIEVQLPVLFRVRYHPAIVAATMRNLNDRYGIGSLDAIYATRDRTIGTAAHGWATQVTAGISIAEVVADLDAGAAPETKILRARWADTLAGVRRVIKGTLATSHAHVTAWMDSALRLTFVATKDETGGVIISALAHHAEHGRVPLPETELDYWVPVLFSPLQLPAVTPHGAQLGYAQPQNTKRASRPAKYPSLTAPEPILSAATAAEIPRLIELEDSPT